MTTIVFDLDGTLVDTAPDIHAIANRVLEAEGAAPITLEQTHGFIGNGAPVFVERMAAARGIGKDAGQLERMKARFEEIYSTACEFAAPYPGVPDMLRTLKTDGHILGICTNKPIAPAHFLLDQMALAGFFDVVLGGDSLDVKKPDPAPLLRAFETLGAAGEDRLYVGDSEVDAETAARADVPFALFLGGYRRAPAKELPHEVAFDHFNAIPVFVDNRFA